MCNFWSFTNRNRSKMVEKQAENKQFRHIVRVNNVDIPGNKSIRWALTNIKGVGINFADAVCNIAKIKRDGKAGDLSDKEIETLNTILLNPLKNSIPVWFANRRKDFETGENKHLLTAPLNFTQENDLKRLKKIKTLRGVRHIHGQPVRGQRTRSNFRRNKGKVVGVKKKAEAPKKDAAAKK